MGAPLAAWAQKWLDMHNVNDQRPDRRGLLVDGCGLMALPGRPCAIDGRAAAPIALGIRLITRRPYKESGRVRRPDSELVAIGSTAGQITGLRR